MQPTVALVMKCFKRRPVLRQGRPSFDVRAHGAGEIGGDAQKRGDGGLIRGKGGSRSAAGM
jgi:hypothetical protein